MVFLFDCGSELAAMRKWREAEMRQTGAAVGEENCWKENVQGVERMYRGRGQTVKDVAVQETLTCVLMTKLRVLVMGQQVRRMHVRGKCSCGKKGAWQELMW